MSWSWTCWRTIDGNRVRIPNCIEPWKASVLFVAGLTVPAGGAGFVAGGVSAAGGAGSGVSVGADAGARLVLVAVAWVDMPDEAGAIELKRLLDRPGTGNITELSRDRVRYRNVHFDGEHHASRREGTTVVNAQAEPMGRVGAATDLAELARAALS
jgi:hypothetical protein